MEIKKIISKYLDSNTFVVKKDGKCLIIDAGADIGNIDSQVGENKVVAILLTHGHYDHVINSEELAKKYNCKIYINENAEKTVKNPKLNYGETFKVENMKDFVFTHDDSELILENFIDYSQQIHSVVAYSHPKFPDVGIYTGLREEAIFFNFPSSTKRLMMRQAVDFSNWQRNWNSRRVMTALVAKCSVSLASISSLVRGMECCFKFER